MNAVGQVERVGTPRVHDLAVFRVQREDGVHRHRAVEMLCVPVVPVEGAANIIAGVLLGV